MNFLNRGSRVAATLALGLTVMVFRASPVFAASPPANDDFDHATVIATTPFTDSVDTSGATTAGDDPTSCAPAHNTVWYAITPSANETIVADASGGNYPATVSAYTGSRGALSQVACGGPFAAQWAATAGVTYHILVSSIFGSGGLLNLHVTATSPPPNDDFDHATVIAALPFTTTVDTTGATSAPDDPSGCGGTGHSVWYSLTPSVDETVFASASGGSGFPAVSAYTGGRGSLTPVACGSFGPGPASWAASAGVTYHIMVVSIGPFSGGTLTLQVTGAFPPPNDDFNQATSIPAVPFTTTVDVSGATTAADDPTACGGARESVWYRFTPTVSETFIANTGGSTYQPSVSVYTGSRGSLTQVACQGGFPTSAPVKWAGTAGVTYYIMAANSSPFGQGANDHLNLNVTGMVPPANDDFNNATVVSSLPFTDSIDASGATAAPDDPTTCGSTDSSVWYSLTPTVNELIIVDTSGSSYTPIVSAYTGARGSLTQVACGGGFFPTTTSFPVTAGVTYHIMVANNSFFSTAGHLMLHLTGKLAPANDSIGHATVITRLPFTDHIDTSAATTVPSDPTCIAPPQATVWYRFTPRVSGFVTLSSAGSDYQASVSAYTGTPGALTQIACGAPATGIVRVTKGVTYYFMVSSLSSAQGGNLQFQVTALTDVSATSPCTAELTGKILNGVTVRSGSMCIGGATINGGVAVLPGAQLFILNSTIGGSLTSNGATALTICNTSIGGQLTVRASTGPVLIGDGGDGIGVCTGNKIGASVRIGEGNTSGVELGGNTITGHVTVSGNNPNPANALSADDAALEIEANTIGSGISCAHNSATPVNDGKLNTISGIRSGQCQAI